MNYTGADMHRAARIARVLIGAALRNGGIRQYIREGLMSIESVRANPPVRHEFEHAYAICGVGEGVAACRKKPTFGEFIGVLPIEPDDPVSDMFILFVYKPTSKYNQRVIQRRWMKERLGSGWRRLVKLASTNTKARFLSLIGPDDRGRILMTLRVDPAEFWRMAKGAKLVEIPTRPLQGALFDNSDREDESEAIPLPMLGDMP